MKMIFHTPFMVNENRVSASQIRPQKMLNAFKDYGYEVFQITGEAKERRALLKELKLKLINGEKFDFCYSESSTMANALTDKNHFPKNPFLEFYIFNLLKKYSIPIGLFYRDIYWKFPDYKNSVGTLKYLIAEKFYKLDLILYQKYVDVLFLPTEMMSKYLPISLRSKVVELPPACEYNLFFQNYNQPLVIDKNSILNFIYVGGITPPHYDLSPLFSAAKGNPIFEFNIVCRQEEWLKVKDYYSVPDNVKIRHVSGEELRDLYLRSSVFLNIRKHDEYLDFAMPMKIFEAIQYRLPIITSKFKAVSDFVLKNNIGLVLENDDNLSEIFKKISERTDNLNNWRENIENVYIENTWKNRVEYVKNKLKK